MSLLAQQRARMLEKLAKEKAATTAPATAPAASPKPAATTPAAAPAPSPATSRLGSARAGLLAKTLRPTTSAPSASTASKGTVGGEAVLDSAMLKAKSLMQTAEEQLATDKAAGLFDLAEVVNPEIPAQKFMETFQQLRFAQLAKTPELPQLQVLTMNNLRNYEELAHILTDAQIAVVVSGALEVANVKMATGKSKANATKTVAAKAASLNLSDFG